MTPSLQYIKTKYPSTNERLELLEKWRSGKANRREAEAAWAVLAYNVHGKVKRRYKKEYSPGWGVASISDIEKVDTTHFMFEDQQERVLMLAEWIKQRTDKSVAWCLVSWRFRFAEFEARLELKRHGVYVDNLTCRELQAYIECRKHFREHKSLDIEVLIEARKAKYKRITPIQVEWVEFEYRKIAQVLETFLQTKHIDEVTGE